MTPQAICHVAIARRDVTPPVGIYHRMWGAAKNDVARGIHRPLLATAVVFQPPENKGDEKEVVVAVDHCLLFAPEVRNIVQRVCSISSIQPSQIIVAFSHTHAAGMMDPRRHEFAGGEMIAPYLDTLADSIADAVQEALANTQLATITYATGRCSLAANRDYWDEDREQYVCGFNPKIMTDDTLLVGRITSSTHELLGTVVHYACHPTTLAWGNELISPDYPGALREVVEQATGAPCVFLQGASGDLGPRDGFVGDTEIADRNGRQLAYAALSTLESMPPAGTKYVYSGPVVSGATIGVWQHQMLADDAIRPIRTWKVNRSTISLAYSEATPSLEEAQRDYQHWQKEQRSALDRQDERGAADARAMVERMRRWLTRLSYLPDGNEFPYPITIWRMGHSVWLAVDGEPYNQLQTSLRDRFPDTPIVVMVLANGSRAWYLPDRNTYGKGIYQESMAHVRQGSLEEVIEVIGDQIARLLNESDN